MDELLEQFLIEGRDLVAQASGDFSILLHDPQNEPAIDSAFRAVHTLKGSVGLFAMVPAQRVLHAAEDVLERARKGRLGLQPAIVAALTACIDQVDRWIDDMGEVGKLPDAAEALAAKVIGALPSDETPLAPSASQYDGARDWLAGITERDAEIIAGATGSLTAFRYTPDPDCYFRGDDPLAIIAAAPDILSLSVLPVGGAWPIADELEPFVSFSQFEGLSAASIENLKIAFRLVIDQTEFATIDQATGETAGSAIAEGSRASGSLRISTSRMDALADGLGELIVAINAIAPLADQLGPLDTHLAARLRNAQANLERVTNQLYRNVSSIRSVPLEPALRRLPRMAREIAEALGKQAHFALAADGIEVDKQIADGIFEPLIHLIRNAVDHGIESPADRLAAGKPATGQLSLTAARDGDSITIAVSDDGAGIDPERIRQTALDRSFRTAEELAALGDSAILQLIFLPGFSTAHQVTSISGRGVGMDAVQHSVAQLRGTIDVVSALGKGTTFRMRLPVNSLTTRLLVVNAADNRFGVSLDQVIETARIDQGALKPVGRGVACVLRGRTIPVLSLSHLLGGSDNKDDNARLIVTQCAGELVALRVDGFGARIDAVVRPPSGVLASVPGVIGSALLGDGDVLLVLDLPELAA